VIEIDADDEPEGVMINGQRASIDKNKKAVVHPIDWSKHSKVNLFLPLFMLLACTDYMSTFDIFFSVATNPE
jgi:hypothetical protein